MTWTTHFTMRAPQPLKTETATLFINRALQPNLLQNVTKWVEMIVNKGSCNTPTPRVTRKIIKKFRPLHPPLKYLQNQLHHSKWTMSNNKNKCKVRKKYEKTYQIYRRPSWEAQMRRRETRRSKKCFRILRQPIDKPIAHSHSKINS